jgi:hypothetical protein
LKSLITTGSGSFQTCSSLSNVELPAAVTIGISTFSGCVFSSINLPSAKTIRGIAFADCTNLSVVSLPVADTVEGEAFWGCSSLQNLVLPALTRVQQRIVWNCSSITNIALPSVTVVDGEAFLLNPSLLSITFGASIVPSENADVYTGSPNVINYVSNPTATGWGTTWNGQPVVRLPLFGSLTLTNGTTISDGVLNGTNGIYFTPRGSTTNYWITFP